VAKAAPNPHGSVGDPVHQAAADRLVEKLEKKHPAADVILENKSIKKQTGLNVRPDAAVIEHGEVVEVGEAARTNKDGTLVAREQRKQERYKEAGIPSTVEKIPPEE